MIHEEPTRVGLTVPGGGPVDPVAEEPVPRQGFTTGRSPEAVRTRAAEPVLAPRPAYSAAVGTMLMLLGAWGALVPFVGPLFGYGPPGVGAWHWSTTHLILSVAPGAALFVAGLMLLGTSPLRRGGAVRGLAGWLAVAAGAWFVLGTSVYPMFFTPTVSSAMPFTGATGGAVGSSSQVGAFLNWLGWYAGVGVVGAVLGGVALTLSSHRAAVRLGWMSRPVEDEEIDLRRDHAA